MAPEAAACNERSEKGMPFDEMSVPSQWLVADVSLLKILRITLMVASACLVFLAAAEWLHFCPSVLSGLYSALYRMDFMHANMAEATIATMSFALWINVYHVIDSLPGLERYRFGGRQRTELGLLPNTTDMKSFGNFDHTNGVKLRAGFYYIALIWLWHRFVRSKRPLELEAPELGRYLIEVAVGIFWYDFLFYWVHLALHWLPRCCRRFESLGHSSVHHAQNYLRAEEVLHHSFVDAFLQVFVNIVVQQTGPFGPKHTLSRLTHNVLVTFLLTESHAGYDAPWSLHRLLPGLYGGAYRHELHHKYGNCCFHQFFTYLDNALGFAPKGYHVLVDDKSLKCK